VLVAAAEEALAELEELSVIEAWVPVAVVLSVLVAAEALVPVEVPVVVPVSVELELELLELELAPVEQTAAVGRSVTPPLAQRPRATLMVAVMYVSCVLCRCDCTMAFAGRNHALSWSALEHFCATQHETSLRKDLASQMHLKSTPQLWGMAAVAHSFCLDCQQRESAVLRVNTYGAVR
jgi:hypothetical protein